MNDLVADKANYLPAPEGIRDIPSIGDALSSHAFLPPFSRRHARIASSLCLKTKGLGSSLDSVAKVWLTSL